MGTGNAKARSRANLVLTVQPLSQKVKRKRINE